VGTKKERNSKIALEKTDYVKLSKMEGDHREVRKQPSAILKEKPGNCDNVLKHKHACKDIEGATSE